LPLTGWMIDCLVIPAARATSSIDAPSVTALGEHAQRDIGQRVDVVGFARFHAGVRERASERARAGGLSARPIEPLGKKCRQHRVDLRVRANDHRPQRVERAWCCSNGGWTAPPICPISPPTCSRTRSGSPTESSSCNAFDVERIAQRDRPRSRRRGERLLLQPPVDLVERIPIDAVKPRERRRRYAWRAARCSAVQGLSGSSASVNVCSNVRPPTCRRAV